MPTLLQINTVVNSGSTGRISEEIGRLVIKNGWSSYIAYGRHERYSDSKLIKIGTNLDIKLHVLRTRLFDEHGLGSYSATLKFIKQIEKIKPDVIHLQNLHGYYLNIKVLFEYLSKVDIPIVWTFYDCWPMTGHCTYFDYVKCEKWKTGCSHCPQTKSYPASFLIDRSKRNYLLKKDLFTSIKGMTILSNSNWLRNIINQSFFKKYPVRVINSGIDVNIFKPVANEKFRKKFEIEDKFIILGVANQWIHRKGLSDFIELSKMITPNDIIILVGLNPKQMKNKPSNVIGISRTESMQDLANLYSAADVFINPTWEDNFPTTNLEALSCGTPIISYDTGGSIESVSPTTGFIVEKGNVSAILEAIETIKQKPRKAYLKSCRERAKMLYDKEDRYLDYLNLYRSIIAE